MGLNSHPMLLRQTLLYMPAQVIGPLVQLAAMVIWTHFLVPQEMGVYALIVAAQELIYSLTLFWFSLATVRYHDHLGGREVHDAFLSTETAAVFAASILASLAVLALPLLVADAWSTGLVAATMAYTVTRGMVSHYSDRARAEHDTLTYSIMQIIWPVLGLALGLVFVHVFAAKTVWVLWGAVAANLIALLCAAVRMNFVTTPRGVSSPVVRQALRYGIPLVAGSVLVWIAQNSLRFVVEWKEGAAAVGLITVGWGLGLRVSAFASMLVTAAAFPLAVKRSRERNLDEGQAQLERNGILLLAAILPACFGLWIVGNHFVDLTVAEPFRDITKIVLPWAILAGGMRSLRLHFGEQVFLLRERTLVTLSNDLVDAVLATAGILLGLLSHGLEGAVIGGAIGATAATLVTLLWAWLAHGFTLPLGDGLKIVCATALMVAAVWALPTQPTILWLVASVVVGAIVYALGLVLFGPTWRQDLWALVKRSQHVDDV